LSAAPGARLLIATTNAGKLREIRELLAASPIELRSLADLPPIPEPEETERTFRENARLKARYYASRTRPPVVAEDSGLVIDALGGEPGIRSARFLHETATYADRFAEIERRLAERPDAPRTARFVCALAVAQGADILFEATGTIEGLIAPTPAGNGGFGYDPIFYHPPLGATLAEVDRAAKLRVAHRGKAFRALAHWLAGGAESDPRPG
jgi:XTP/dITP diphosphohydrolase